MFPFCFFFPYHYWLWVSWKCTKLWGMAAKRESGNEFSGSVGRWLHPALFAHTILHSGLWSFLLLLIKSYHIHLVSIRVWKCCLQDPPTIWNSLVGFFPPLISTNIQPPKLEMFREIVEFTHQELPCLTEAINVRMFMIRTQFYTQLNILSNRTTQSWTNWYQCPLQLNVLTF